MSKIVGTWKWDWVLVGSQRRDLDENYAERPPNLPDLLARSSEKNTVVASKQKPQISTRQNDEPRSTFDGGFEQFQDLDRHRSEQR